MAQVTSLREDVFLGQVDALGPRVVVIHAHDKVAVEDIKLLAAVPVDGATQAPNHGEQEESLKPHCNLLAGHGFFLICS